MLILYLCHASLSRRLFDILDNVEFDIEFQDIYIGQTFRVYAIQKHTHLLVYCIAGVRVVIRLPARRTAVDADCGICSKLTVHTHLPRLAYARKRLLSFRSTEKVDFPDTPYTKQAQDKWEKAGNEDIRTSGQDDD